MEVEALVSSSTICRRHGALQESLAIVTYLSDIVQECKSVGLNIDTTAQHEVASVLWDQGEIETSIRMREYLIEHAAFDSQDTDISLPVLLAKLVSITLSRYDSTILTFVGTPSGRSAVGKT
jgi:ataxia telangiectasia mutated family protein